MKLRIISYNIHKGFNSRNKKFILDEIRESINIFPTELVFLQEVVGSSGAGIHNSQFEFLADTVWPHHYYEKNAISSSGHHGNAILSKNPFIYTKKIDLSVNKLDRKGMIHGIIKIPNRELDLHVICVHLSLLEKDRKKQVKMMNKYIKDNIPEKNPLIIAGDFNDWRNFITSNFFNTHQLKEAFLSDQGECVKSFPSFLPILRLDRIYFRNIELISTNIKKGHPWSKLSDHLAIFAEFKI